MDPNALYYALSTIAQVAATLAALIGFLGMWRLDRLRDEAKQVERMLTEFIRLSPYPWESPSSDPPRESAIISRAQVFLRARQIVNEPRRPGERSHAEILLRIPVSVTLNRWDVLESEQRRLRRPLIGILAVTLVILILSIAGFIFAKELPGWKWTPWLILAASVCLGMGPAYVLYQAARSVAPLEPTALMYLADRHQYDAVQAMVAREQERRPPANNSTAAEAGDEP